MLLKKLGPADTQRPALEEIRKAGEMATVLTRQLLAFSRKQVLRPQVLDLSTVVSNMEIMLRRLIGEDIELIVLPGAALDRVKADPGQIEQVVMNLVVNARDAMPSGGKLTIETADVDLDEEYARRHGGVQPGPYVWLSVSDTGCGMDAETQARIFEPFFTSKVRGKGTGLGLATVYGIIKQSGGWISVYSEVGQGTVFKIYLPRVPDSVEVPQQKEIQQKLPGGGETILVAEDDQSVRAVVCGALAETGYTVLEARDGPEALRVAKEYSGPIHLLITDVVMPQMSGRELVQCLLAQRPATRLLYMSGYTDDAFGNHGVLAGSASFLQKPFSADTLSRKVREVLDQPKQRAGRRPSHRR
jgi:CheY-like chemotaxis protein